MNEWYTALLVALIAALPGLLAIYRQRRKDESTLAETYEAMATRQAKEITELRRCQQELEDKVDELEGYVKELESGVHLLINQLQANRIEPVWKPRTRNTK